MWCEMCIEYGALLHTKGFRLLSCRSDVRHIWDILIWTRARTLNEDQVYTLDLSMKTLMCPLGLLLIYPHSWNIYIQICTYIYTNMYVCTCYPQWRSSACKDVLMWISYVCRLCCKHAHVRRDADVRHIWVLIGTRARTLNEDQVHVNMYLWEYYTCQHFCKHTHACKDADVSPEAVANVPSVTHIEQRFYTDIIYPHPHTHVCTDAGVSSEAIANVASVTHIQ